MSQKCSLFPVITIYFRIKICTLIEDSFCQFICIKLYLLWDGFNTQNFAIVFRDRFFVFVFNKNISVQDPLSECKVSC